MGQPLHIYGNSLVKPRSAETLLSAIVNSSDDAIIGKTLDGEITTWNRAAEQMYGYAAEEIVGQSIAVLCPVDRAGEISEILGKISRGERVVHFETVRRRKDGTTLPVSVTVSPVHDDQGVLLGASSIARDITDRYHAQSQIRRQRDELERAYQDLESFSASVSHDLRAPLRSMQGFSSALLEEYGDALGDNGRDYARRIRVASEKMARLIDELLRLSRGTRAGIYLEPVDLGAEANEIAAELQRLEPGRRVRFSIKQPVWVTADRSLILVALQNLLGNAWKFSSGQDEATIEFGTVSAGSGRICCFVRDNGAGFDAASAEKLFRPFSRLHTVDEFPGTGIGLATVRQIVERHAGQVWGEGAVGAGATFYFTLLAGDAPSAAGWYAPAFDA
jgi:PAS domain S-box-containing protein